MSAKKTGFITSIYYLGEEIPGLLNANIQNAGDGQKIYRKSIFDRKNGKILQSLSCQHSFKQMTVLKKRSVK
jgi:hypothetical protein